MDISATTSHSRTQAANLFNLSDFLHFICAQGTNYLTHIFLILWTFCSNMRHATCDMRHAAHCKLDALLDHGFHDITTCITLPSTSLAQHPIGDLTDISTTLRITLGFSICRQLPKGFRCLSTWKPLHQTPYLSRSLLSPSRCNRDRREIGLMKTAISHEFVQNSLIHVTKSSPGLPF
jgi:hypothetical protein